MKRTTTTTTTTKGTKGTKGTKRTSKPKSTGSAIHHPGRVNRCDKNTTSCSVCGEAHGTGRKGKGKRAVAKDQPSVKVGRSTVTRSSVEAALENAKRLGAEAFHAEGGYTGSRKLFVEYRGIRLAPKAVLGAAAGLKYDKFPLRTMATIGKLEELGVDVWWIGEDTDEA